MIPNAVDIKKRHSPSIAFVGTDTYTRVKKVSLRRISQMKLEEDKTTKYNPEENYGGPCVDEGCRHAEILLRKVISKVVLIYVSLFLLFISI